MSNKPNSATAGVLVILALLEISILVQFAYLAKQEYDTHEALVQRIDAQGEALEGAEKVKAQLESLAAQTAQLAEQDNENAARFVEALREQGISIRNPN